MAVGLSAFTWVAIRRRLDDDAKQQFVCTAETVCLFYVSVSANSVDLDPGA
ncbi:hypothetical protein J6590_008631 [Homalodisca vitripennis]|nr:hypothetical protein J6590_008631 [Homalodisca vitripennis]